MPEGARGNTEEGGRQTVNILMSNAMGKAMKNGRDVLVKNGYSSDSDPIDEKWVIRTIRTIAAHVKTPKAASEGLKALADVAEAMAKQRMVDDITEIVTKDIREIVGEMRTLVRRAADMEQRTAETLAEVQDAAGAVKVMKRDISTIVSAPPKTYADAAKRDSTPAKVAAVADRQETRSRQIIIQKADNIELKDYDLAALNEKELVEKANIALEGIQLIDGYPGGTRFLGARKLKGGDVLLILNSAAAQNWLSNTDIAKAFLAGFNGTSKMRTPMLTVVAEYVPVSVNPTEKGAILSIEQEGGLERGSIKSAAWIRPIEHRSPTQQYAHMKIKFGDRDQANKAIRDGLFIGGKVITVRKDVQEPPICYRCHSIGDGHYTNNCTAVQRDICGHCRQEYRAALCPHPHQKWCANCKRPGHGAGDRSCEMRQQGLEAWRKANLEAGYRFFLDNEDPKTWEELEFIEEAWGPTGRRLLKDTNEGERPMAGQRGFGPGGRQTYRDH